MFVFCIIERAPPFGFQDETVGSYSSHEGHDVLQPVTLKLPILNITKPSSPLVLGKRFGNVWDASMRLLSRRRSSEGVREVPEGCALTDVPQ